MQEKNRERAAGAEDPSGPQDPTCPTPDEVEAWARAEKKRREAWLAGPTEDEKRAWVRRERSRRSAVDPEVDRAARRFYREMELAGVGFLYALSRAPFEAYARLVRMGADWEEGFSRPYSPQRVPFEDTEV